MAPSHSLLMLAVLYCVSLAPFCRVTAAKDLTNKERSAIVDEFFERWSRSGSPGFALGIVRNGEFVHKQGYGFANVGEEIAICSATNFPLMSINKSFETACVALLLDQGVLLPDVDIRTYIPELPEHVAPITIRNLVTCRSGLRDCWFLNILSGRSEEDAYSRKDEIDLILRQKSLMFPPDQEFGYSNSDYVLLQEIMQRVTGKSYSELLAELISSPLGMKNTFLSDGLSIRRKNFALGYTGDNREKYWHYTPNLRCEGGGMMRTTVEDILLWDTALNNKSFPPGKHINEFLEKGALFGNMNCLSAFPGDYKGLKRLWYTGGGWGFHSHYVRFPEQRFSIVAMSNAYNETSWEAAENVLPKITDLYLAEQIDSSAAVESREKKDDPIIELSDAELAKLATRLGHYRIRRDAFGHLEMHGQDLHLVELSEAHNPKGKPTVLAPIGANRFRSSRGFYEFELTLSSQDVGDRLPVTLTFEDGTKQKWKPVEFVRLTTEDMAEYLGEYYCADIDFLYSLTVNEDKLFVRFNFGRERELIPTVKDIFILTKERFNGTSFTFSRDQSGKITGFGLEFGRVKSLQFKKR